MEMFCQLSSLCVIIAQRWEKGAFNYQMETSLLHPISFLVPFIPPMCPFSACLVSHYSLFTLHFTLAINWSSFVQDDPENGPFIGRYDAIYWLVFLELVVSQGVVGFGGREGGGD